MQARRKTEIPISLLRELLDYDPVTGIFIWRTRGPQHFVGRSWGWKTWNAMWAGKRAGSPHGNGYLKTTITIGGKQYSVFMHQVAVAMMTDAWPEHETDHLNHDRSDNRWVNLKPVTLGQNQQNLIGAKRHNKTGFLGVSPWGKRYFARIRVDGEIHHLGVFDTPEAAHARYMEAKHELHGR